MNQFHIRKAVKEDLAVLLDFEQGIVEAERPFDETLKPGYINYYDLGELIESSNAEVIVAEIGNEIIGSAYIQFRPAKAYLKHAVYGYLGFMFVKPEHRGKGVNKRILEELKVLAMANNVKELRLDVYDVNIPALRAYEKAGFKKHLINMRIEI